MGWLSVQIGNPPLRRLNTSAAVPPLAALMLFVASPAYNHAKAETPEQGAKASVASNHLERQMFSKLNALWVREEDRKRTDPRQVNRLASLDENPGLNSTEAGNKPENTLTDRAEAEASNAELEQVASNPETLDIGVFPDEEFELCGYKQFSARLAGSAKDRDSVIVRSRDRTIPNIPFRGFEMKFPLETRADFWPGCSVIAGFVDVAGVIRIGLSVRENRDFK